MGNRTGKIIRRAGLACLLFIICLALAPSARTAEYPRRIAIAPFVSVSREDIQQTVSVLPRLLMSRLMAVAGAEVVLLPAGGKPPIEQAKGAGLPLLMQGTVTRVGKGYSIDVTATEVASGKLAGAFFASAATEDEIIPELGALSGDIVEKLFGIKAAPKTVTAAPAPPSPAALPSAAAATAALAPGAPAPTPAPPTGPWEPRSIVQVAVSDKIPDEIYKISSGDVDGDGSEEVAAIGSRKLWVYKVTGDQVLPFRKMERSLSHLFLNVEMADIDGDGRAEIVVTNLVGNRLQTFVLKYKGEAIEQVALDIPYYVISIEDGKGKRRLAGQRMGVSEPFSGKVVYLKWNGKTLVPDGNVPVAVDKGIFGLAAFPGDAENRFLYIDAEEHIRLLDSKGKTRYKSKEYYSGALHSFISGPETRSNVGVERQYIRGRIVPAVSEGAATVFLVRQAKGNVLFKGTKTFEWSRLVFLSWAGDGFSERAASERIDNLMTDFAVLGGKAGPGARVAVPVIESSSFMGSMTSDPVSRIRLYRID